MQATLGENIKIINLSLRRRQKWQKGLCLVLKRHDFSATQGKYPGPLIKLQLHCSFCMKVKALVKHVFRCTSQLCSFCCSQIKPRSGLSIFHFYNWSKTTSCIHTLGLCQVAPKKKSTYIINVGPKLPVSVRDKLG